MVRTSFCVKAAECRAAGFGEGADDSDRFCGAFYLKKQVKYG